MSQVKGAVAILEDKLTANLSSVRQVRVPCGVRVESGRSTHTVRQDDRRIRIKSCTQNDCNQSRKNRI